MRTRFYSQDLWSGILFMVAGGAAVVLSNAYSMGFAARIGPGYFPRALGYLLMAIGLIMAVAAFRKSVEGIHFAGPWLPVVLVPAGVAVFAAALLPLGLPCAIILLTVVAAGASRDLRLVEVGGLALGMAGVFSVVFIQLLKLPLPMWPWFLR